MRLRSGGHFRSEMEAVISGLKKEALNTLLFSTENGGGRHAAAPQRDHVERTNDGLGGGGDAAINGSHVQVENQSLWLRILGNSLKMSSKSWTLVLSLSTTNIRSIILTSKRFPFSEGRGNPLPPSALYKFPFSLLVNSR